MKIILFIVIIIASLSCTTNDLKNKSSDKDSVSGCDLFKDTLIYGAEQMSPSNSPVEFINIREIFSRVKNDYHQLDIEMQSIPDSICYNNPNISKGFAEFGMDIILRNKLDSTNIDNLAQCLDIQYQGNYVYQVNIQIIGNMVFGQLIINLGKLSLL